MKSKAECLCSDRYASASGAGEGRENGGWGLNRASAQELLDKHF